MNDLKYHCMMCNTVYDNKADEWINTSEYVEKHKNAKITSGIYHTLCVDDYVDNYISFTSAVVVTKIKESFERRIVDVMKILKGK